MKQDVIEKLYTRLFATAKLIIDGGDEQPPLIFQFTDEKGEPEIGSGALLHGDPETVGRTLRELSVNCGLHRGFVYLHEGWFKFFDEGEAIPDLPEGGVQALPGAQEGLRFNFFGRDWEYTAVCLIRRKPDRLEAGELIDGKSEGRLSPFGNRL